MDHNARSYTQGLEHMWKTFNMEDGAATDTAPANCSNNIFKRILVAV